MAVSVTSITDNYNDLLTATLREYRPKLVDNVFRSLPLLYWLNSKGRKRTQNGGYEIIEPLLYAENTTPQLMEGYDVINVVPQEAMTVSRWAWKTIVDSITISREEERKNSGQYKIINLLQQKTDSAELSLKAYLARILHGIYGAHALTYTGGDTNSVDSVGGVRLGSAKGFNSLDHIIRSAWGMIDPATATARSHTVGGITVTLASDGGGSYAGWGDLVMGAQTNPWWMNYTNPGFDLIAQDGTIGGSMGTLLSLDELKWAGLVAFGDTTYALINAMRAMYTRLSDGVDKPDLILSSGEVLNLYESMLMPLERYEDKSMGDPGFENLKFRRCTFIHDAGITTRLATTGHSATAPAVPMYMINSKYLNWVVDSQSDFATTPFRQPEDQLARTAQIVLMANLTCSNRQKQGLLSLAEIATNGWSATT